MFRQDRRDRGYWTSSKCFARSNVGRKLIRSSSQARRPVNHVPSLRPLGVIRNGINFKVGSVELSFCTWLTTPLALMGGIHAACLSITCPPRLYDDLRRRQLQHRSHLAAEYQTDAPLPDSCLTFDQYIGSFFQPGNYATALLPASSCVYNSTRLSFRSVKMQRGLEGY